MEYNFSEIEKKWQQRWAEKKPFRAENNSLKEKYYVLDMFPYPSGAGLHVGHPLGYIASDIVSRYKRHKGFNVLHPMGYDSFGLPAEQYAIQTGQHPAVTTENNIKRYREQLDKIGFSFDWEREVRTSEPEFYKWTQWIFIQLFNSWYNKKTNKSEKIETLREEFDKNGNKNEIAVVDDNWHKKILPQVYGFRLDWNGVFNTEEWNALNEKSKQEILMHFRLAYLSIAHVNWCPALGTVLANEEVKDGVSERGGYPVERKLMDQWSLRITAYAERLLNDLDLIEWGESLKEAQRNWIGQSKGCSIKFKLSPISLANIQGLNEDYIEVFTTRPDTIFGVSFLALAPENLLGTTLPLDRETRLKVSEYLSYALNRSERDRMAEVKKITGVFTGAYVIHPFTEKQIPIWIADYVLTGYGTGAVMGVPAHDTRDFAFAKHFGLEIIKVIEPNSLSTLQKGSGDEVFDTYDGYCINSDFINKLQVKDAIKKIISEIEKRNLGKGKTNYRLRDAIFGRQRYWGEPIPIYYKEGTPYTVDEKDLPVVLPEVDKYLPTETGNPPLARAKDWKYKPKKSFWQNLSGQFWNLMKNKSWKYKEIYDYEYTTMPGWAGSSWYYLRYMDAKNENAFASKEAINYWKDVDLYIGGSEHATGHLLYVRFWTKFLHDLGYIPIIEPAKKLINQGMIQGMSEKIYRRNSNSNILNGGILQSASNTTTDINFGHVNLTVFYSAENVENAFAYFKENKSNIPNDHSFWQEIKFLDNVEIGIVENGYLRIDKFIDWRPEYKDAIFVCSGGYWYKGEFNKFIDFNGQFLEISNGSNKFKTVQEIEKMSKSKYNVVNPDDMCEQYGADCFRMYEMFLGPLEQSKPWNTNGITGVFNFLKKFWRLFHSSPLEKGPGDEAALKILHRTIKKVTEDIENYSFNTSVSAFMICVNELTDLKCSKREILETLCILISPFAPHIAEELWEKLGHAGSITYAQWPKFDEKYLVENSFEYPVSINGKTRFKIPLSLKLTKEQIETEVLKTDEMKKYLDGNAPKKVIIVPGRIVNVVI